MKLSIKQRATLTTTLGKFELVKVFLDKSIVEFNELLEEPKSSQCPIDAESFCVMKPGFECEDCPVYKRHRAEEEERITKDNAWENMGYREYRKTTLTSAVQMDGPFVVETLEGDMRGEPGDYVCMDSQNNPYPCKKAIFEEMYVEASPPLKVYLAGAKRRRVL